MVWSEDFFGNAGIIAAAVLAVLVVALSTYSRRLIRHPVLRFLMWGASTAFLPLTSSIISSLLEKARPEPRPDGTMPPTGKNNPDIQNMWTLLLWIVLILTIKSNADVAAAAVTAAAASPAVGGGDGMSIRPPVELVAQYAWVAYLVVVCFPLAGWLGAVNKAIFVAFSVLGLAKLALKLAAFYFAGYSFALGKNAPLVAGYMEQQLVVADGQAPRYIVMGERKRHVEESTRGYRVKPDVLVDKHSGLVTLDRVWHLAEQRDGILAEHRDLCLSFSLFKILRLRLSGFPMPDAGSVEAREFVLRGMDSVGAVNSDRVFRVLEDELWFASDFYYSAIPLSSFGGWSAVLNYLCSALIIVGAVAVGWIYVVKEVVNTVPYYVITFSLLLAVVLVEAWEIVAGVCSNWTKMALLGHYMRRQSAWRRFRSFLAAVLRLRPARRWRDTIGQNSVLEPNRFRMRTGLLSEQLYGRAGLMKSIKVSPTVKDAVLRSLLSSYGRLPAKDDNAAARRVGGKVDWARYGSGQKSWAWDGGTSSNTELILVWHVATRLFEMKSTAATPDMVVAGNLSYYCAYLVAAAPELLPDSAAWTEKRYKEVADDVRAALRAEKAATTGTGESTAARYERLVRALSAGERDAVLRRGAELGRHLVEEYAGDEASACRILADFWSDMLLYVAPSEEVKGHVEAMARGGEFITLVWALLLHAGITDRPHDTPGP
ncbi:hypothetical protein EJB05_30636, partial [Eragrostis curvula]